MSKCVEFFDAEDACNQVESSLEGLEQLAIYMESSSTDFLGVATLLQNSATQGLNELATIKSYFEEVRDHKPEHQVANG
ncbi:MAG: hypothetical protein KZQ89_01585 [Candidatus Thiodiazotropha sp. (ex Lucinoma kastoroae)]|nr:hypothetical protein [Candidatus Thiodiazotropha sp. (ex Lucinoma kastoroae)]